MSSKNESNIQWTEKEEAALYEMRWNGINYKIISVQLGRSPEACEKKYRKTAWEAKPFYDAAKCRLKENIKKTINDQISEANDKKIISNNYLAEILADRLEMAVKSLPNVPKKLFVPNKQKTKQKHSPEDVGLILSDTHIGHHHTLEETGGISEYNMDTFKKRVEFIKVATSDIVELHSNLYDLPNLHIFCPGDIVAGMNGVGAWSASYINTSIVDQAMEGASSLADMINYWLTLFDDIYFYGVYGNHGRCQPTDVRALTPDGYKKYDELKVGDKVGTIDTKTGDFEFQPINKIHVFEDEETIVQMRNQAFCLECTKDHDVLHKSRNTGSYDKIKGKDLLSNVGTEYHIPISVPSNNKEYDIQDDVLSLLGWIMTDGGYVEKCQSVLLYQSKDKGCEKIRGILGRLGVEYREIVRDRKKETVILGRCVMTKKKDITFYINSCDLTKMVHEILPNSKDIPSWMYNLSDRQVKVLLDSIVDGDGTCRIGGMKKDGYARKSRQDAVWGGKEFLEKLSGLLVSHNIPCSVNLHKRKTKKYTVDGKEQIAYYLQLRDAPCFSVKKKDCKEVGYNGKVWCVTVKNGNFAVISKEGDPYFTGNCSQRGVEKEYVNWDYICYKFLEATFANNPRVHFAIPKTWWLATEVRGHKFLMLHGDEIKGGPKALEEATEKLSSLIGGLPEYTIAGHFHTAADYSTNFGRVLLNGSFVGGDIFSIKSLRKSSKPEQKIFGIHDKRGMTWSYNIDLSTAR